MCSYMRLYAYKVCFLIENRWKCPIQTLKNVTVKPKLFDEWNKKELQESDQNYRALYAIISVVSTNDIKYISEFKSSKEA